jgi:hypothetical protein
MNNLSAHSLRISIGYQYGTPACTPTRPRTTTITFQCAPQIDIGSPIGMFNGSVESPACSYSFLWRTKYACPLCTSADIDSYVTECVRNQQTERFFWHQPKFCRDGVALPKDRTVQCQAINVPCTGGQFYNRTASACQTCPANTYR